MQNAAVDEFFWDNREQIKVLDIELKNGEMMQTFTLLETLKLENPDLELYFIMGSDLLEHYTSWENGKKL